MSEPYKINFPTMLRKMWSGSEVQAFLDKLPPLFTAQPEPVEEPNDCPLCEGHGWVSVHSKRPPAFDVCPECFNPEDLPCP